MKVFTKSYIYILSKLFLISILILCVSQSVQALKISEVMYDPSGADAGREWIEIYNDESTPIDMSLYKLNVYKVSTSTGTNHGIEARDILFPGEYAIMADDINKFKIDYPAYMGHLYNSSFSLPNTGNIISFKKLISDNQYKVESEIDYTQYTIGNAQGGVCDSNIKAASVWSACVPVPNGKAVVGGRDMGIVAGGTASSTASSTASTTASGNGVSTQIVSSGVAVGVSYYVPNTNIYLRIGNMTLESQKEKRVIAGTEIDLAVRAYDDKNIPVKGLKYYWSMGEGGYFEGENIKYIYHMPGDYEYTVEAGNESSYSIYRGTMHVHEPRIRISSIGTSTNYIMLKNDLDVEMDIGGYLLKDNVNNKTYKIPRNTFIKASKEIKLIGAAMGFVSTSSDNFTLSSTNGVLIYQYFPISKPIQKVADANTPIQKVVDATTTTQKVFTTTHNSISSTTNKISYSHRLSH